MKDFKKWLSEAEVQNPINYTTPTSLEMRMGNVITPLDPNSENWLGEAVRLSEYVKIGEEIKKALDDKDDALIRELLSQTKSMPLFRNEQDTIWKKAQIDGLEEFRSDAEFRRWIAGYIINKINLFKDWVNNKTEI
jgi:hypothetical protein